MERQTIYLEKYDWAASVFYDTAGKDIRYILSALLDLGCTGKWLENSRRVLGRGNDNVGMTFSNPRLRESVMVMGHASSLREFLNTWQHEMTHLCRHICEHYDIDPFSEEAAYLAGDIAAEMHSVLSHYICACGINN